MAEQFYGEGVIETAASVERPQALEGRVPVLSLENILLKEREDFRIAPFGQQLAGLARKPVVPVRKESDELLARQPGQVEGPPGRRGGRGTGSGFSVPGLNLVNPAVAAVPGVERVDVGGAFVVPIGHVNRAVGTRCQVDRTEPDVVGGQQFAAEMRLETGPVALEHMPIEGVGQQIAGDVNAGEPPWKRAALVEDPAAGDVAALKAGIRDVIKVTERIRIMKRAVFAESLDIVAALHLMQADLLPKIGPGDDVAVFVEVESPGVAAAFGE